MIRPEKGKPCLLHFLGQRLVNALVPDCAEALTHSEGGRVMLHRFSHPAVVPGNVS